MGGRGGRRGGATVWDCCGVRLYAGVKGGELLRGIMLGVCGGGSNCECRAQSPPTR